MTREEAIKILRKEIECMSHAKCKDCILEAVCDPNKTPCDSEYIEIYEMAIKALEQEPKTGHWMRKTKVDGVYDIAGVKTWGVKCQCDKCDFTTTVIEDFGYYKYCPNCGAKMIDQKESEDVFSDYPDMPYQFDNMTGSMNL